MKITFSKNAREDYISWKKEDKKILGRINSLIKDIQRTTFEGSGKPEPNIRKNLLNELELKRAIYPE